MKFLRWSKYEKILNGWIPKLSLFVPLIGYLLLFNDHSSRALSFNQIIDGVAVVNCELSASNILCIGNLSDVYRLRFLYFGFLFLGAANLLYLASRPEIFKLARDRATYKKEALEFYHLPYYIRFYENQLKYKSEKIPRISEDEWDSFTVETLATDWSGGEGSTLIVGNWEAAKLKYHNLLSNLLWYNFEKHDASKCSFLIACLILASIGYFCLLTPSADLFVKVVKTMLPA